MPGLRKAVDALGIERWIKNRHEKPRDRQRQQPRRVVDTEDERARRLASKPSSNAPAAMPAIEAYWNADAAD
jgi:hypothetical protein